MTIKNSPTFFLLLSYKSIMPITKLIYKSYGSSIDIKTQQQRTEKIKRNICEKINLYSVLRKKIVD